MKDYEFWQQKLIQFFHDPPGKPFASLPKAGGLERAAERIFDAFQQHQEQRKWRYWYKSADWVAAGADRPLFYTPREKGVSPLGNVVWAKSPVISHPLAPNGRVRIPTTNVTRSKEDPLEQEQLDLDAILSEQVDVAKELGALVTDWKSASRLNEAFVVLWRRYREELNSRRKLSSENAQDDPLWNVVPPDSRCPDHSIWEHLKVVTAAAFMKPHRWKEEPGEEGTREPWLLRMTLGPVGGFIGQSRTTRDLWMSSFLLSDLAFAALSPFIERYGPDSSIYPDLFRNPRADLWLSEHFRDALPENADVGSFAAVLPESFVVLAPRGGEGHLLPIEQLAEEGRKRVAHRWAQYAEVVRHWFGKLDANTAVGSFEEIWSRQMKQCPIHVTWSALPWKPPGHLKSAESLRGQALPVQKGRPGTDEEDQRKIALREARLKSWLPTEVWVHYERARGVFGRSHLDLLQLERGFDYALTHHQLSARQASRLQTAPAAMALREPGEKCTLCGLREALHTGEKVSGSLTERRRLAQQLWKNGKLDPNQVGAERLCAVCATKRFLVEADQEGLVFNRLWAGNEPVRGLYADGKVRVPFPSTATIAAQDFLETVVRGDATLTGPLSKVVMASRRAKLGRTSFPNALPRLAACKRQDTYRFLELEAEDVVFYEALNGKIHACKDVEERKALSELRDAVRALRAAAPVQPKTHIAVVRVDGDHLGRLLLGDKDAIATRWKDVVHPDVLKRLPKRSHLVNAGWLSLLEAKRLMGPTLHAFISRVLGNFAHRVAPFVVEHEFSGRLVYAGGDDILAIAPAHEAIAIVARLQQLFSAAWLLDTEPQQQPWSWRKPTWAGEYNPPKARQRFVIPQVNQQGEIDPSRDWHSVRHIVDVEFEPLREAPGWRGELMAMMGPGVSLSAGVAVGHYKTPMSVLLQRSHELLKQAKEAGRARVGFGHASRGGTKSGAVLPWGQGNQSAYCTIETVVEGFKRRQIPSRLPYKLREVAPALRVEVESVQERELLCRGLFSSCWDEGSSQPKLRDAAYRLWYQGVAACHERAIEGGVCDYEPATEGLLFCRELAGLGGET